MLFRSLSFTMPRNYTFHRRDIPCPFVTSGKCDRYFINHSGVTRHVNAVHRIPTHAPPPTTPDLLFDPDPDINLLPDEVASSSSSPRVSNSEEGSSQQPEAVDKEAQARTTVYHPSLNGTYLFRIRIVYIRSQTRRQNCSTSLRQTRYLSSPRHTRLI